MHVNLVASESMPSLHVMMASAYPGYVQTVEGRVGKRWFPGTHGIDALELVVEDRSKLLFGFPEANVQPHSATQANQAVYISALKPGDTILAMAFTSGGHLSHGFGTSLASKFVSHQYLLRPLVLPVARSGRYRKESPGGKTGSDCGRMLRVPARNPV